MPTKCAFIRAARSRRGAMALGSDLYGNTSGRVLRGRLLQRLWCVKGAGSCTGAACVLKLSLLCSRASDDVDYDLSRRVGGRRLDINVQATVAAGRYSYLHIPDGLVTTPPMAGSTFIFVVFLHDIYNNPCVRCTNSFYILVLFTGPSLSATDGSSCRCVALI
eukprot:SAG11_NODE_143_length_14870_cov_6.472412_7_plen_163_part_00